MERIKLVIDGMSCGHCVARVTQALAALDGVRVEEVKLGAASLDFDPAKLTPARIASAVSEIGFPARAQA